MNDYFLFPKQNNGLTNIATVYVDDIILTCDDTLEIEPLKQHLSKIFNIKDLGVLHYFLGLEVGYVLKGIVLSHSKFT